MLELALILNGPPGVGKDTLADLIVSYGFDKHIFKQALYVETAKYWGVDLAEFTYQATHRTLKELPWKPLEWSTGADCSPRQALIYVSEQIIKPTKGKTFFGRQAATACQEAESEFTVFSDGGFYAELDPIIGTFREVAVIRLHREGFNFDGDSRDYLYPDDCRSLDLHLTFGQEYSAVLEILSYVQKIRLPWYKIA
jgi:hypothetical protein